MVAVVEALRDHCPWTAALTHGDLAEYLVEEAYEAVAEIEARDAAAWADVPARRADGAYSALAAELGDVLFQVVLHAAVSRPPGAPVSSAGFRVADAADALTAKMIRRNPLVLTPEGAPRSAEELARVTPEAVELAWEEVKAQERAAAGETASGEAAQAGAVGAAADQASERCAHDSPHVETSHGESRAQRGVREVAGETAGQAGGPASDPGFGGIPARLPALAAAAKVVDRAARQPADPLARHAPLSGDPDSGHRAGHAAPDDGDPGWGDEAALGAELFALVRRARAAGLDPERALRGTVARVRSGDWDALRPPTAG
nr:MazG nucleotide pyrophosphohydrolase domain-containing protein [Micrococcus endophyticus]